MPDDDKVKISDLTAAITLDNTDDLVIDQTINGSRITKRTALAVLGSHIAEEMEFSSELLTESKKIIGAINELQQGGGGGGSSTLAGLTDVAISSASNNQVLKYNSTSQKWENANGSGSDSWVDVTGTLNAGSTSIILSNAAITTASTIDYYTDVFGVSPTNAVISTGQVVLTFEAQPNNLGVKVRVS